jgi:hypothetical protein
VASIPIELPTLRFLVATHTTFSPVVASVPGNPGDSHGDDEAPQPKSDDQQLQAGEMNNRLSMRDGTAAAVHNRCCCPTM